MGILRDPLAMSKLGRKEIPTTNRRPSPVPSHRRWSLIIGILLAFLAFPSLALAGNNFYLQVAGPHMARPGDLIVYTVTYQNVAWPLLTHVALIGQIPEHTSFVSASPNCQLIENSLACLVGALQEGDGGHVEMTFRMDEDAPADTIVKGKVVAVGKKPDGKPLLLDYAWLKTMIVVPQLTITKQPSADIIYAGEQVTYTYTVTNSGDVTLRDITLEDDHKLSSLVCDPVGKLMPGQAFDCTWTTTLEADTTNIATATALDPWGDPVTATASALVNVLQQPQPGGSGIIALDKDANAEAVYIGDTVTYTYIVSNTSDDPVLDISLTDDQLGVIAASFDLEAGEDATFVTSTVLTTDTTNLAAAAGLNLLGDEVQAQASEFVSVVAPDVNLSLSLTASATRVYTGDIVTYTYVVTNTGSDIAYHVILSDDLAGVIDGPFDLADGESHTFEISRMLDEDTTVAATVTGEDGLGKNLWATASVFVDTIQRPGPNGEGILSLSITPNATNVEAGTMVTYAYLVTNLSQDPVSNIVVMDDLFGFIAPSGGVTALDVYEGFTLQGGESRTLTLTTPLYENTWNVATVTGQDLLLTVVQAEAEAFVEIWTTAHQDHVVFLPLVCLNGP